MVEGLDIDSHIRTITTPPTLAQVGLNRICDPCFFSALKKSGLYHINSIMELFQHPFSFFLFLFFTQSGTAAKAGSSVKLLHSVFS